MKNVSIIAAAEAALERGDYGQCLDLLEPLLQKHPLTDQQGSKIETQSDQQVTKH